MKAIFDASALLNLAANGGSSAPTAVMGGCSLSLAYFELGNSVLKLHHLLKKLSTEDDRSLLSGSLELLSQLTIQVLGREDAAEIERLGIERKLSFYDSVYLYAAKREKLTLVTDDEALLKVARIEKVETLKSLSILTENEE
jgi:predicted nucleic acid-binding protein